MLTADTSMAGVPAWPITIWAFDMMPLGMSAYANPRSYGDIAQFQDPHH